QVKYLDVGKIPVTTIEQPKGTGATYSPSFITYGMSYARAFTDMITLGVTVKFITEQVMDARATGIAFDAGLQYNTGVEGLMMGFVIQNVGDNMRFDGESLNEPNTLYPKRTVIASFPLPTTIQFGLTYDYRIDDVNTLEVNGKVQSNSFDTDQYITGLEYNFNGQVFLRGSYEFHGEAQKDPFGKNLFTYNFAVGAGVHIQFSTETDLYVDYAYRNSDIFTGSHSLGIRISL
ncbi:MAG: PorV/PorQ family protein, partial [Bacteroidota bacterium]